MKGRLAKTTAFLAGAALVLAGCGGAEAPSDDAPPTDSDTEEAAPEE